MDSDKNEFLSQLVALHGDALEHYLARKLDSTEDAAEVAQDAFLRMYRMEAPQQLDNARAFLFQVATNLAVDQLRRRRLYSRFLKSERQLAPGDETTDPNASAVSPEHILSAREKLQAIYNAVDELPVHIRQAFLLHRRSGLSYLEIAQEMGVSVSSVEKYILQSLRHCHRRLAQFYPQQDESDKS